MKEENRINEEDVLGKPLRGLNNKRPVALGHHMGGAGGRGAGRGVGVPGQHTPMIRGSQAGTAATTTTTTTRGTGSATPY